MHSTARVRERAVLVAVDTPRALIPVRDSLLELQRLAATAGLEKLPVRHDAARSR